MHRVVDDNSQRNRRNSGDREANLTDDECPGAKGRQNRQAVRDQTQKTKLKTLQRQHQDYRDCGNGHNRASNHVGNVSIRDVGEHDLRARRTGLHPLGQVLLHPRFGCVKQAFCLN